MADLAAEVERLRRDGLPIAEPRMGKIVREDGSTATWGMAGLTEGPAWMPEGYVLPLAGGHVRLVPGTAERITAVAFAGAEDPQGETHGLRFVRA